MPQDVHKLDALATMIEYERRTYEQWLSQPEKISSLARKHFEPLHESFDWGKWNFVGNHGADRVVIPQV